MSKKILIVEDEQKLADLLADYLRKAGYSYEQIINGLDVVPWARENLPDLILLDLNLPGRDGLDICKEIRSFTSIPIIMITARIEEIDRLLGLELGADDYICKPFSPREVVARVKAVLRRTEDGVRIKASGLTLDESTYQAKLDGKDLDLTALEFKLFSYLAANPDRIFSRDQLMDRIYFDDRIVSQRTIDSHIKKLRQKISSVSPEVELIQSVYGVGYRFMSK